MGSEEWRTHGDNSLDYGAIILNSPIGKRTGTFSLSAFPASKLRDMMLNVIGYPQHHQQQMWGDAGRVLSNGVWTRTLRYHIDTEPGESGSPCIFVPNDSKPDEAVFCVGIHNYYHENTNENVATRITEPVLANIQSWLKAAENFV